MFSIFRKKKVNINSVTIPDFGWDKIKDEQSVIQWMNPEHTAMVSIYFFDNPPDDIPTIKNIELLRKANRQAIVNVNGGLIEVDLIQKKTMTLVKTIFKLPQQKAGMIYNASLTLPFRTCSFIFKVQAMESGMTGIREAMVADRLLKENIISVDENGFSNWFSDPYDDSFQGGTLMNKAEHFNYDVEFPTHPLTQVRHLLKQIEDGLQWRNELENLALLDR